MEWIPSAVMLTGLGLQSGSPFSWNFYKHRSLRCPFLVKHDWGRDREPACSHRPHLLRKPA